MTFKEFRQIRKVTYNSLCYDDFFQVGKQMEYGDEYIKICWQRFIKDQMGFIADHDMGELLFGMILNKIEADQLLNF